MVRRTIFFLTFLMASGLASLASAQALGPRVSTGELHMDLGRRLSDIEIRHSFELTNTGDRSLRITNVKLSGKGIRIKLPRDVAPGNTGKIEVMVDASGLVGDWEWRVSIETNDPGTPAVSYTLQATLFPAIEFVPSRTVFFSLFDDQSASKRIIVRNHADRPLKITGIERSGESIETALGTNIPGREYTLDITVPKRVSPGRYRESLILRTDDPKKPALNVPVNIFVKSDLYTSPETANFGQLDRERIKRDASILAFLTQTILVTHRYGKFAIGDITSDIPFLTTKKTPPGESKVFRLDIGLDPARMTEGPFAGRITIRTDDPRFPHIEVPVSGEIR